MRIFDTKSPHWAIRHVYVIMAAVGVGILVLSYPITLYLAERNQENSKDVSIDNPNFMYYPNGGDSTIVGLLSFGIGIGLILLSPIIAVGYILIRRGVNFESLKPKGSCVE
jgi:hypothetical protein